MIRPETNAVNGRYNDRLAGQRATCEWCNEPQLSHAHWCPSLPASSQGRVVDHFIAYRAGQALATPVAARRAAGSSWTRHGARDFRSWSVTGSSGSVCRRLRLARSANTLGQRRSTAGTAPTKTQDSSKSSSGEVATIGMVDRIVANERRQR